MEKLEIEILIYTVSFVLFFIVFFILAIFFIFNNKQRNNRLKIAALNEQLLQTKIEIQEQTLTNISQELHDNIGQSLSLAKLNLNTLKLNDTIKAHESIEITKGLISQSLVNIRNLAKSMLGEKITELGLQQALENELKIIDHTGQYQITFTANQNCHNLTSQQELLAFRILQEALQNILKHAEASKIDVHFNYSHLQTNIIITDNGKGFNIPNMNINDSGIGFKNMKSRAALIKAEIQVQSAIFKGTSFCLKINSL